MVQEDACTQGKFIASSRPGKKCGILWKMSRAMWTCEMSAHAYGGMFVGSDSQAGVRITFRKEAALEQKGVGF